MNFGNVSKLYGVLAALAGIAALPLGCSGDDFTGCAATRTCPPRNTGGANGEAGGGSDTGGSSGTSSGKGGTSGNGGTAGIDEGGSGGAPDDDEPPTIVEFAPG